MNILHCKPTIQTFVPGILKDSKALYPCRRSGMHQTRVMLFHLFSQKDAIIVFNQIVRLLLPPSLNGEIGLPFCHNDLSRIRVLNDQIAGVSRKIDCIYWLFCPGAELDHFGGTNEMVVDNFLTVLTGSLCLI